MEEDPLKVLSWSMVQAGVMMKEANAETMDLSQQSTIGGIRYKISIEAKLTPIPPSPLSTQTKEI